MIQSTQEQALFLTSNTSQVTFDNDDLRTRSATCCGFLQHEETSPVYKIIEGGVFDVEIGNNQVINFDTSKLTVITCGAFSDMYEKNKRIIKLENLNCDCFQFR